MPLKLTHVLFLLLSMWALPLFADTSKTIYIEADHLKVLNEGKISEYSGNVVVKQGFMKIQADKVELQRTESTTTKLTVWGDPAVFTSTDPLEPINASATSMVWDNVSGWVTLTGNARLSQKENHIEGEKIRYNVQSKQMQAEGGKKRVKLRIKPNELEE